MTLRDRWEANKDRPAWIRRHADELEAATETEIPRNLAELDDWLRRKKAVVTRKLNEADAESDDNGGNE